MSAMKRVAKAGALSLAICAVLASPCLADPYSLGNLGNFAVYGFGTAFTDQLQPGALTVNGNVGIGPGGDLTLGGSGVTISGRIFDYTTAATNITFSGGPNNLSINGTTYPNGVAPATVVAGGGIVENSAIATNAKLDEITLYSTLAGLTQTGTATTLSGQTYNTANGVSNTTVIDVSGNTSLNGPDLTITGDANDFFVFRILGSFAGSSGGVITLNGVSADHVIFDFLCATTVVGVCNATAGAGTSDVTFSGSFQGAGIVFGLERNITQDTPGGFWNGRYFSDTDRTIHLFSEATINQPTITTQSTPEPGTFVLMFSGFAGLGMVVRRRRSGKAA